MTAIERVRVAYQRQREVGRPGLWITLLDEEVVLAQAQEVERRLKAGEQLPLAGLVAALKDNIDLAHVPTTAGCPEFLYLPEKSAFAVQRLIDMGLVILGKANLDQFATGLVGTRSPYGALSSVSDPERVSGGSSSGSAVLVALGIVDVALGTDTAGSGRVPAAFNSIVGLKPTHGLISARGVVPACPSLDCVSIFSRDVTTAHRVLAVAVEEDDQYPFSRSWSTSGELPFGSRPVIGVAAGVCLNGVEPDRLALYERAVAKIEELGINVRTVDIGPMLDAGARLYQGAFVAERYASVGEFVDANRGAVDPTVGEIIAGSKEIPAYVLANDLVEIARVRKLSDAIFREIDVLILPTTGEHPKLGEVEADPFGPNMRLGRFTNFCNLLDLSAIAVPMPTPELRALPAGETFGTTLFAPAFHDQLLAQLAAAFLGEDPLPPLGPKAARVIVVGAHLRGQPLNYQLTDRGGRLVETTSTTDSYRLYALPTEPPKPGLVFVGAGEGSQIEVEVWELDPGKFADFITDVVSPLGVGSIDLADGSALPGFLLLAAEPPSKAVDITGFGGWRAFRSSLG